MHMIACVLKKGGIYTPEHVAALRKMLKAHASEPYQFVCLNDVWSSPDEVDFLSVPLLHDNWHGWWSKIELFRLDWRNGRTVIYFDLDTVIVGDPMALLQKAGPLVAVKDWWHPGVNSSVMILRDVDDGIYRRCRDYGLPSARHIFSGGDQALIDDHFSNIATFPHDVVQSYKENRRRGRHVQPCTVAVQFHGKPKYWECSDGWIARALQGLK